MSLSRKALGSVPSNTYTHTQNELVHKAAPGSYELSPALTPTSPALALTLTHSLQDKTHLPVPSTRGEEASQCYLTGTRPPLVTSLLKDCPLLNTLLKLLTPSPPCLFSHIPTSQCCTFPTHFSPVSSKEKLNFPRAELRSFRPVLHCSPCSSSWHTVGAQ